MNRFKELVQDKNVNVNRVGSFKPLLLHLCHPNGSKNHLYPILEALLKRDDLDVNVTSHCDYNALMFLFRNYFGNNLWDCAQLLIDRGIKVTTMNQNALQILCSYQTGDKIVYYALRLIYQFPELDDGIVCADILSSRGLYEESAIYRRLFKMIRSSHNIVSIICNHILFLQSMKTN